MQSEPSRLRAVDLGGWGQKLDMQASLEYRLVNSLPAGLHSMQHAAIIVQQCGHPRQHVTPCQCCLTSVLSTKP